MIAGSSFTLLISDSKYRLMKIFFTTLLLLATFFSNGMLFSQTQLEEKPQAEKERREPPDTSLFCVVGISTARRWIV